MTELGKIIYNEKKIQIFLTDDFKRYFIGVDEKNNYYELEKYEYEELEKLFNYNNMMVNCDKKNLLYLGMFILLVTSIMACQSKPINFNNYSTDKLIVNLDNNNTISEIIEKNKNLDDNSKIYINNFVNRINDDFDLSIFKANLEKLNIIYLNEEDFNQIISKKNIENAVAFFEPSEFTIYINDNFKESIYHELFHTINNYYIDSVYFSYEDSEGKGRALLEGMTAYYTKEYFKEYSYPEECEYIFLLTLIVGEERVKYYFEKGNVEDTISDLKSIYGDETTANKLIMMMDDNLNNKQMMNEEIYNDNVDEIIFLLQDYYYGSHEKQIESILKEIKDYDTTTKKNITELLLNIFFEKVNVWEVYFDDYNQRNSYNDKKAKSLSNFYNLLVENGICDNKDEYLNLVSRVNEEHENGKYVPYDYDDIKECLKLTDEKVITEESVKIYVKE